MQEHMYTTLYAILEQENIEQLPENWGNIKQTSDSNGKLHKIIPIKITHTIDIGNAILKELHITVYWDRIGDEKQEDWNSQYKAPHVTCITNDGCRYHAYFKDLIDENWEVQISSIAKSKYVDNSAKRVAVEIFNQEYQAIKTITTELICQPLQKLGRAIAGKIFKKFDLLNTQIDEQSKTLPANQEAYKQLINETIHCYNKYNVLLRYKNDNKNIIKILKNIKVNFDPLFKNIENASTENARKDDKNEKNIQVNPIKITFFSPTPKQKIPSSSKNNNYNVNELLETEIKRNEAIKITPEEALQQYFSTNFKIIKEVFHNDPIKIILYQLLCMCDQGDAERFFNLYEVLPNHIIHDLDKYYIRTVPNPNTIAAGDISFITKLLFHESIEKNLNKKLKLIKQFKKNGFNVLEPFAFTRSDYLENKFTTVCFSMIWCVIYRATYEHIPFILDALLNDQHYVDNLKSHYYIMGLKTPANKDIFKIDNLSYCIDTKLIDQNECNKNSILGNILNDALERFNRLIIAILPLGEGKIIFTQTETSQITDLARLAIAIYSITKTLFKVNSTLSDVDHVLDLPAKLQSLFHNQEYFSSFIQDTLYKMAVLHIKMAKLNKAEGKFGDPLAFDMILGIFNYFKNLNFIIFAKILANNIFYIPNNKIKDSFIGIYEEDFDKIKEARKNEQGINFNLGTITTTWKILHLHRDCGENIKKYFDQSFSIDFSGLETKNLIDNTNFTSNIPTNHVSKDEDEYIEEEREERQETKENHHSDTSHPTTNMGI